MKAINADIKGKKYAIANKFPYVTIKENPKFGVELHEENQRGLSKG